MLLVIGGTLAATFATGAGADGVAAGQSKTVTRDRTGGQPNDDVVVEDVTPNGRFVLLSSWASDLVANDTNSRGDIFVRDRLLGVTERVSVSSSEVQGNESSYRASISNDGRRVAFSSYSNNLVTGDTNNDWDVFVRDRANGTTVRASTMTGGTQINGDFGAEDSAISGGGRYVAFETNTPGVVAGETGAEYDIFVKDLVSGTTELASESGAGTDGNDDSRRPSISDDGRYVAFDTFANNLGVTDTNGVIDVYLRDRTGDTTTRVSVSNGEAQGNNQSASPDISGNGLFVAFTSNANNLVAGDVADASADVFVRSLAGGTTTLVSVTSSEVKGNGTSGAASISSNGDRVAFRTWATNLGAPDVLVSGIAVRDLSAGTTHQVPANPDGSDGGEDPHISSEGRYVAWSTQYVPDGDPMNGLAFIRVLAGSTFTDVPNSHLFFEDISWLVDSGITTGFPDDTFRPLDDVTRQAMTAFIYRFAGSPAFSPPVTPTFSDVGVDHPFRKEIEWAAAQGYVDGFPDGSFRPGNDITRMAMAAILYRLAGSPAYTPPGTPTFPDVPVGSSFYKEIEWAAASGIANGFPDGTFRPGDTVTRQSTAAFVFRVFLRGS